MRDFTSACNLHRKKGDKMLGEYAILLFEANQTVK